MKQKLKDLQLLMQGSKKARFFLISGILAVLFLWFKPEPRGQLRYAKAQTQTPKVQTGQLATTEAADDFLSRFKVDVDELKQQNQASKEELESTKKSLQEYESRTAEIMKKMLERINDKDAPTADQAGMIKAPTNSGNQQDPNLDPNSAGFGQPATDPLIDDQTLGSLQQDDATLESFGNEEQEVAPPPAPEPKKIAFVGAGDSVRVKLLAGVNAPTDGTPYPVVFKLTGNIHGPDGSTLPLGEARLIAAAQGSLTDSRALFRMTSLNIRLPSGERKVVNVDGWIVGEDGIRGMPGILIDPIGKAIGGAAFSGAIAGLGTALSSANTTRFIDRTGGLQTAVSGDLAEYAGGRALTEGAREWGSIIRDRVNQMVPVVKVYSGREGTAVFAKSLSLEGLFEALDAGEEGSSLD